MVQVAEGINCPDCGAPLQLAGGEAIVTCSYCGSTVNMAVGSKYFLKHSIIPNRLSPKDVEDLARSWMSGGFLKPDDLARKAKIVSAELTFLPLFVMNAVATTKYKGFFTRAGPAIERSGELKREYFWKVIGRRAAAFPAREYDVPLAAKADFSTSLLTPGSKFLNAEMDDAEAVEKAKQEMEANQRFLLQQDLDAITEATTTFELKDVEFMHAPVWTVKYEYRKRLYELLLDGQSGRDIKGEIPEMEKGTMFGSLFGR